jgi:G:T-mismatch repair DNA endonuclease (very short patch repair protein)
LFELSLKHLKGLAGNENFLLPFGYSICSLSSYTYILFKLIFLNKENIYSVQNEFGIKHKSVSRIEYDWASYNIYANPESEFISAFNNWQGQKFFKECIPDLYSAKTKEALFFNGCYYHGHFENCLINKKATAETKHLSGVSYFETNASFLEKVTALITNNPLEINQVTYIWECDFKNKTMKTKDYIHFKKNVFRNHPLKRLNPRSAVRGAYSEVYKLKWFAYQNSTESFYFLDINGLYSSCAINFNYPIGKYEILIGPQLHNLLISKEGFFIENKKVYGIVFLQILPPQDLLFPYLQYRTKNNKVVLTLCSTCAEFEFKKCTHNENQRALIGTYYFSEIILALKLNYKILQVYECYCYYESKPILREFISCLDTLKQENLLNKKKKTLYKFMANSFFGKFQQKYDKSQTIFVQTQKQIEDVYFSDDQIVDIFCCSEDVCQLQIKPRNPKSQPSRLYNCIIGGQITAYAREIVYQHMISVQEAQGSLFYVDCDCILFSLPTHLKPPLPISTATGHFKHEYKNIQNFCCFNIKNYSVSYLENDLIKKVTKVKGLNLQSYVLKCEMSNDLFSQLFTTLLFNQEQYVLQLRKYRKDQCQRLKSVKFSNLITSKRIVDISDKNYSSVPYGYLPTCS